MSTYNKHLLASLLPYFDDLTIFFVTALLLFRAFLDSLQGEGRNISFHILLLKGPSLTLDNIFG
jgi:hypothetical protein